MTFETVRAILGWSALINMVILTLYFLLLVFASDAIYRLHSRWFSLTRQGFDTVLYAALAFYKIANLLLFLVPYLVMRLCV